MGLVKEQIPNDIHALTEWVARKLQNHHPMEQRAKSRVKKPARQPMKVDHVRGTDHVIYCTEQGQKFRISVECIEGVLGEPLESKRAGKKIRGLPVAQGGRIQSS
jgi:hypothetical protein